MVSESAESVSDTLVRMSSYARSWRFCTVRMIGSTGNSTITTTIGELPLVDGEGHHATPR